MSSVPVFGSHINMIAQLLRDWRLNTNELTNTREVINILLNSIFIELLVSRSLFYCIYVCRSHELYSSIMFTYFSFVGWSWSVKSIRRYCFLWSGKSYSYLLFGIEFGRNIERYFHFLETAKPLLMWSKMHIQVCGTLMIWDEDVNISDFWKTS